MTLDAARELNKHAVSKLVAVFEDTRPAAAAQRAEILRELGPARATVLGITGTPGAGKSSLVARLVPALLADSELSVAVLAVDPSSHVSGGALLGDRTRTRFATGEKRSYFRSQSNAAELGGLAPTTFQVTRLLKRLFDVVIVDSTDPIGVGEVLFTDEFYANCARLLTPRGLVVNQCGVPQMQADELHETSIRRGKVFPDIWAYVAAVPTYVGGFMTLGWAGKDATCRAVPAEEIRRRAQAAGILGTTRYWTPEIHVGAFHLPPYIAEHLPPAQG